jgi:hypothetical protein
MSTNIGGMSATVSGRSLPGKTPVRHALYEASPKLWLKEPGRLGDEAAPGLGVTREQLLAGLLGVRDCVRLLKPMRLASRR